VISMSRYISIVSGVGAGAAVAQRQLIMRAMTQNSVLPPGLVAQFANAAAVGAYFGTSSEEYYRATAYFAFINKNINSPKLISFARWVAAAIAPMIVGDSIAKVLASFVAQTGGTLTINDGATPVLVTGLNFSTATTLTQVASILQTALRATADAQLATCTVTFNTNTNQFVLTGSNTGSGSLSATPTVLTTDVSALLGWSTGGTVLVAGQAADTPDVAVSKSAAISDNFGSFVYCTPSTALTNTQIAAIAAWNDAQNNKFLYSVATPLANLQTLYALVKGYSGLGLNILSTTQANDYIEQSPCEILAATNYNAAAASQNYMFYQFASRNTTVSDDNTANTVDASRGNYIGVTQSAGQQLAFYQRGVLCGGSTAAVDMNTYANEMWMKSAFTANFMSLFLNVPEVPADDTGAAMLLGVMQPTITLAKANGVIAAGKTLSSVQQQYITSITADPNAWRQVQTLGYWLQITFTSQVNANSGLTEWVANYLFVYSKSDAIRSVSGSDVMI
jgi:hypothetical protein